jgi:hypothetical protein
VLFSAGRSFGEIVATLGQVSHFSAAPTERVGESGFTTLPPEPALGSLSKGPPRQEREEKDHLQQAFCPASISQHQMTLFRALNNT